MVPIDIQDYSPTRCINWEIAPRINPCRWTFWEGPWRFKAKMLQTVEVRRSQDALALEQPFTLRDWKVFRRAVDRSIDENY